MPRKKKPVPTPLEDPTSLERAVDRAAEKALVQVEAKLAAKLEAQAQEGAHAVGHAIGGLTAGSERILETSDAPTPAVPGGAGMLLYDPNTTAQLQHRRDVEIAYARTEEAVTERMAAQISETRKAVLDVVAATTSKERAATALLANAPAPPHPGALSSREVVTAWLGTYASWFARVQRWREHGDYEAGGW
jgi:hypothetical protein